MAQLRRIILIHTHLPGVVELNLDGHTNICGTNASGKTTLQRLIPVFYGEQPNRVVPKTRKKFDEFYLPFDNSYLVYEYENGHGNTCQVVLTRKNDGGVEYRFVPAAYSHEQLLNESKNGAVGVSQSDWLARLQEQDCKATSKITATSEYKAIIQNDFTMMRGQSRDNLKMRQTAARFALCKSPQKLRHIEKLVSAVHAKEGKMDTLRTMLATILEEEGNHQPTQAIKATKIRQWLQQMRLFKGLSNLEKQYQAMGDLVTESQDNLSELWQLKPLLEADANTLKSQIAEAEVSVSELEKERENFRDSFEEKKSELSQKVTTDELKLEETERWLDRNQRQYDDFIEQDMSAIARDYELLPDFRESLEQTQESYQLLVDAHASQQQVLDQQKLKLRESLDRLVKRNQSQIRGIDEQQREEKRKLETEQSNIRQKFEREQQELQGQLQSEIDALNERLLRLQVTSEAVSLTTEEQMQVAEYEARVETIQNELDSAREVLGDHERALQKLSEQQKNADEALANARKALNAAQQHESALQAQANPDERSLRFFLNNEVKDWHQGVGKVLAENLLARTDLQPALAKKAAKQILDIELSLDNVEAQPYAQAEAELSTQLEDAREQRQQAEKQVKVAEIELSNAHGSYKETQEAHTTAKHQVKKLEQERAYARESKQRLSQELEQSAKQRNKSATSELQKLEKQLTELRNAKEDELAERRHGLEAQLLELTADAQEKLAEYDERRQQLETQIDDKRSDIEEKVKALEIDFGDELAQQGIDKKKLAKLKEEKEALQQKIRQLEGKRDALRAYQVFMAEDYEKTRPEMLNRERELQQSLRANRRELDKLVASGKDSQQQLQQRLQTSKQRKKDAENLLNSVLPFMSQLHNLPVAEQPNKTQYAQLSVEERVHRCSEGLATRDRVERQLKNRLEHFESALRKDATPDFLDTIEQQLGALEDSLVGHDVYGVLGGLLTLLRDQQTQVVEQGRTIGNALLNFFSIFEDINQRVEQFSRRLSQAVRDDLELDEVEKSEVRISSTIDELGFWEPLKQCAKHILAWRDSGQSLPSQAYMDSLAEVAEMLRADQEYALESLLRIELHLREGGTDLIIRNDRQLLESSSHGMAYLILCKYLLAFTRLLKGDADTRIHWPIDEIGTLAYHNVERLFAACDKNSIDIVGAFPNPESDVLMLFKHRYLIEVDGADNSKRVLKRIEPRVSKLSQKLKQARQEVEA